MIDGGGNGWEHTVDAQLGMSNDLLDLALILEILERSPCK